MEWKGEKEIKMNDRNEKNSTICTPTFFLTRKFSSASSILGAIVFALFVLAILMLIVGLFYVLTAGLTLLVRNACIIGLCILIYLCVLCLFLLDVLSSIDTNLSKVTKKLDKIEEISYNQFVITSAKKIGKDSKET
jgi:hypothetical protein